MKRKIFEPARHNEESPAEGMASVNTFNPEETPLEEMQEDQASKEEQLSREKAQGQRRHEESNSE